MKASIVIVILAIGALSTGMRAAAQGGNGRGECKQTVDIAYYKTPPGKQDEWLALYKKWHLPIMQYQIAHGAAISEKIFAAGSHSLSPSWDFAIIVVSPAPGEGKPLPLKRSALIRQLFPNIDEYVAGEKARWALTQAHWDESLVELDPDEEPFSVYAPVAGGCK
jgi:hypothetical protein